MSCTTPSTRSSYITSALECISFASDEWACGTGALYWFLSAVNSDSGLGLYGVWSTPHAPPE